MRSIGIQLCILSTIFLATPLGGAVMTINLDQRNPVIAKNPSDNIVSCHRPSSLNAMEIIRTGHTTIYVSPDLPAPYTDTISQIQIQYEHQNIIIKKLAAVDKTPGTPVPEPATIAFLIAGVILLFYGKRRRPLP